MLRGGFEPHGVLKEHIKFDTVPNGSKFAGRLRLTLLRSAAEKQRPLSIRNTEIPSEASDSACRDQVENPEDPLCPVRLIKYYYDTWFPPDYQGTFWRRPAPKKQLKQRVDAGIKLYYGDMSKQGVFGTNYFTELKKRLAERCGFANADHYTARSGRRGGVSTMAAADVPSQVAMTAARHSTVDSHAKYQELNSAMQDKRREAFLYKPEPVDSTPHPVASTPHPISTMAHPMPPPVPIAAMAPQVPTMVPTVASMPQYQPYVAPAPHNPMFQPTFQYMPTPSYAAHSTYQFVAAPQTPYQPHMQAPPAPAPNGYYDQNGHFHYFHH